MPPRKPLLIGAAAEPAAADGGPAESTAADRAAAKATAADRTAAESTTAADRTPAHATAADRSALRESIARQQRQQPQRCSANKTKLFHRFHGRLLGAVIDGMRISPQRYSPQLGEKVPAPPLGRAIVILRAVPTGPGLAGRRLRIYRRSVLRRSGAGALQ